MIYDDERQNALARATFKEVVQLRRSILERSKGIDDRIADLCMGLENLGETYVDGGDVPEGLIFYREALGLRQELNAAHPGDRGYAMDVVESGSRLETSCDRPTICRKRRQSYDHARDIIRPLLEAEAEDSELQGQLARVLERKAGVLADLGQSEDALGLLNQAVELARASLKTAEDGKKPREYLSEALWNRARLLRERGQEKEASRLEDERIALWKERPPPILSIWQQGGRASRRDRLRRDTGLDRRTEGPQARSRSGRRQPLPRADSRIQGLRQTQGQSRSRAAS